MLNLDYLTVDPEKTDYPAKSVSLKVKNGDVELLGRCHIPSLKSSDEKCPAVLILHGFPGNEKFYDLSQALRRVGFVAINAGFRGCWGCSGTYSLDTLPSDALANYYYIKEHAEELHVDPQRIYIIGHSMGGFTTMRLLADGIDVKGAILLAPCNIAQTNEDRKKVLFADGAPFLSLGEKGVEGLFSDCEAHKEEWKFQNLAKNVKKTVPLLFIGASRDTSCPVENHMNMAVEALEERGADISSSMYDSDHSFQTVRIALFKEIASWLINKENKGF